MLAHQGGKVFLGAAGTFCLHDWKLVVSYARGGSGLPLGFALLCLLVHEGFRGAGSSQWGFSLDMLPPSCPCMAEILNSVGIVSFNSLLLPLPCPPHTPSADLTPIFPLSSSATELCVERSDVEVF